MANSREQPAEVVTVPPPPVFENPVYRDPIRYPQAEELENNLKRKFRVSLMETAQDLLKELTT